MDDLLTVIDKMKVNLKQNSLYFCTDEAGETARCTYEVPAQEVLP